MGMFWLGVAAFALASFAANMFDAEFREARARLVVGLLIGPFYVFALLTDRCFPRGKRISPTALQRFVGLNKQARGWAAMTYRGGGVLLIRRPRKK